MVLSLEVLESSAKLIVLLFSCKMSFDFVHFKVSDLKCSFLLVPLEHTLDTRGDRFICDFSVRLTSQIYGVLGQERSAIRVFDLCHIIIFFII